MTRRRDEDRIEITDAWQQRVDELLDLSGAVTFLPPSVQVGWMEPGQLEGGYRYCLDCSPQQPTVTHTPVYAHSVFATRPCVVCGRRLDSPIS